MSTIDNRYTMQANLSIGNVDHSVDVTVEKDLLVLQIENCKSFDQWTGRYDASCK